MAHHKPQSVSNRRVFYIPGYDPFPPRRYRELYRTESAAQAAISGYQISQKPKKGPGPYGWRVTAAIDGTTTASEMNILIWSDIVRDSMQAGIAATYWLLLKTFWIYVSTGAIFRLFRLRAGPGIAAMYPVVMLLGQLALALMLAAGVGWALSYLMPSVAAYVLGLAVVPPVLMLFRRLDGRFFVYYLLHDYAFTARHLGRNPPQLQARLREMADMIADALQDDTLDEVLVVGHSSGVHLGVSILANVVRRGAVSDDGPRLAFLSLGHCVPMQSYLPHADALRADLHYLSQRRELTWVDVTAPGDGCCYALCDPVATSGAAPAKGQRWPIVVSAAFSQSLTPQTYAKYKRRYFRLHFQYLCAFDAPRDYDYFQITAGPRTLADRYAGRGSSASTTRRSLNPYATRMPE
ncbi:hypothetical protein [Roseicitreum antarcticum]|uniref:Lipase (Class 3) n=1 Tax=Roseicitreum antarcticum TaxID=564137 RepID=A0A1H2QXI9_9RHOB|nr:hypothetical protein [Roseicitreum antarcticum]SDW11896.1 hypothetical protein SAMN04488238_101134 [Roseicitreum antarcticum]